jgi:hypothetical protein
MGWVKKTATNKAINFGVIDGNAESAGKRAEIVWYTNGRLYGEFSDNANIFVSSSVPSNDVEWHFITTIFDGSGATNYDKVKLYFDGVLLTDLTQRGTISSIISSTGSFWIGNKETGNSSGLVDEVRIYNTALTVTQIESQYYAGLDRLLAKGLMNEAEYQQRLTIKQ